MLLALAFWRAVEEERLSAGYPYAFQPWQSVGGGGVLRGFRYAARVTLADLAHLALVVSDNDAANIVLAFIGSEAVNDLAGQLGLATYGAIAQWAVAVVGAAILIFILKVLGIFK